MTKKIQEACKQYEDMLLNGTKYSGNKKAGQKIFSASMLGSDILQCYYKFLYGNEEQNEFGMNTLGSIYQLGVDKIIEDDDKLKNHYQNAFRMNYKLDNGWTISGETDQIDTVNNVIFDNKVVTTTVVDKIKREGKDHSYALQMAVYKWLLNKTLEDKDITYTAVLALVDKKFSYYNKYNKYNNLTFIEVDTYSLEETEQMLLDKTNKLQEYIDKQEIPDVCSNRFPYRQKGVSMTKYMRCIHYCNYKKQCEYYSDYNVINDITSL